MKRTVNPASIQSFIHLDNEADQRLARRLSIECRALEGVAGGRYVDPFGTYRAIRECLQSNGLVVVVSP